MPGKAPSRPAKDGTELRRRAEARLADCAAPAPPEEEAEAKRLLHELRVHQVELELQNEELKTARVQVEQGLSRYTALFDFAPIGYATLSKPGEVLEVNHAGAQLLRRPRAGVVGRRFAQFVAADSLEDYANLLARALSDGSREQCDLRVDPGSAAGAGLRDLHVSVGLTDGPEPVLLLAFEDVTEAKSEAALLEHTEEALRDASRRKDEFLATLSHELRNPLAPIRNCLYVLSRIEPGSEQGRKALAIIDRQTAHLSRLVDDLLDMTRITRGKIQLHREPLELRELIRSAVEDHQSAFEAAGVSLEATLGPDPLWITADRARLSQILSNLLGNAEKFTPRGGSVGVTLEVGGGTAFVHVRDTGIGIAPEVVEHVFEPFVQGPQTLDRAHGGLGLGLATAKGLVELHGGSIKILSEGVGQGTAIVVALPIEPQDRAQPNPADTAGPALP